MRVFFLFFFLLYSFDLNAQIKTLIPADEEVNLPSRDNGMIGVQTSFDETRILEKNIVPLFIQTIKNTMNEDYYYILDSSSNYIELFIVYPCKSFNLENIQAHQIINEGLITSTLYIKFDSVKYDIFLRDFEWVNKQKKKTSIDYLYRQYQKNTDIKFKLKYYGILKSCEFSITESLNNIIVIVDEIIKEKALSSRQ